MSEAGDVDVRLRLPTPQCAPNFAFLMAADARAAVLALPEAREVTVVLEDHYTGEEINAAVGRGDGFDAAFPGETEGDLDALRELFRRKALVAREGRLLATVDDPASATLGQLADPTRIVAGRCGARSGWTRATTPLRSSRATAARSRPVRSPGSGGWRA